MLLDHELRGHGMAPGDVAGYEREEHTHLAVAAAVAAGRADAGLGIRAATQPFGLDFVPVAQEPYDLVLTQQIYDSDVLAPYGPYWPTTQLPHLDRRPGRLLQRRNRPPHPVAAAPPGRHSERYGRAGRRHAGSRLL